MKARNHRPPPKDYAAEVAHLGAQLGKRGAQLAVARAQLAEANEGLEARVQQRTAELTRANESLRREIADRERAEALVRQQAQELRAANVELARSNRLMVDRELRMVELKEEINRLCAQSGQPPRYSLAFVKEQT